jgi:hypothetical protein
MKMCFKFGQTYGPHRESAWSMAFSYFLSIFCNYVEAEQDLERIDHSQDLALVFWTRDRDVALARLERAIASLCQLSVRLPEDRPAQRFVALIGRMLDDRDSKCPRQLHREMLASVSSQYQVAGFGPIAQHRNAMLTQARNLVGAMIALPFYDYLPPAEAELVSEADDPQICTF